MVGWAEAGGLYPKLQIPGGKAAAIPHPHTPLKLSSGKTQVEASSYVPERSVRSSSRLLPRDHPLPLSRCLGAYARRDAERVGVADITCSGRRRRNAVAARGRGSGRGRRRRAGRAVLLLGCSGAEAATRRQRVRSLLGAVQHGGAAGRGQRLRTALSPRWSSRQPGGRGAP